MGSKGSSASKFEKKRLGEGGGGGGGGGGMPCSHKQGFQKKRVIFKT